MVKKDKKPKKRANIAVNIQSSSEEDIRRLHPAQKRAREDNTSSPEGQQDKRPTMEGQTEDSWGQWLKASNRGQSEDNWGRWQKATLEDRGVGDLFESISGMVNKVLEKQTALFKVVAADTYQKEKELDKCSRSVLIHNADKLVSAMEFADNLDINYSLEDIVTKTLHKMCIVQVYHLCDGCLHCRQRDPGEGSHLCLCGPWISQEEISSV